MHQPAWQSRPMIRSLSSAWPGDADRTLRPVPAGDQRASGRLRKPLPCADHLDRQSFSIVKALLCPGRKRMGRRRREPAPVSPRWGPGGSWPRSGGDPRVSRSGSTLTRPFIHGWRGARRPFSFLLVSRPSPGRAGGAEDGFLPLMRSRPVRCCGDRGAAVVFLAWRSPGAAASSRPTAPVVRRPTRLGFACPADSGGQERNSDQTEGPPSQSIRVE